MATSSNRRFLLLADLPPCQNYTGGIVLDSLVRHLDPSSLYSCVVLNPGLKDAAFTPDLKIRHRFLVKPREYGSGIASLQRDIRSEFIAIPRLIQEIAEIVEKERITDIWCVLQGQTMVRIANQIADKTSLPLYTEVWDPIDWWLRDHGLNRISRKRVNAQFDQAIKRSQGCATASIPMATRYRQEYGVRAVPVMHGLPAAIARRGEFRSDGVIRIGISGQLYARAEFDQLVRVLGSVDWKLQGKSVEVHLFGREFNLKTDKELNIFYRGWRTQERLIEDLAKLDFLYCPYWFDARYESEARNSFPSKITTYFASGRPVLFHGPKYSSVADLFSSESCGITCNDDADSSLLASLRQITDPAIAVQVVTQANRVFENLFTVDAQKRAFLEFLEIGT